ncbi:H-NS histone family protein [Roseomonas frigidaquae]|uniref:H-NS histone family protein n=1 Tax=Falsiroseomonas frigidaquae TaxID=487318 RepID=A0ABX1F462_9PROT|nr:H-NS histone family protein [Falsiroseomonas frigidaquae]NKE47092.1 H-NS histone family protein [Falsiroseomonas frigidaquae]
MANKFSFDLDAMSVPDLTALIGAAEEKRKEKLEDAKSALMAEFEQKAAALGVTVNELYSRTAEPASPRTRKPRKDAGQPAGVKYRGPHGETWSGRGRRPGWLNEALAQGKGVADFLA